MIARLLSPLALVLALALAPQATAQSPRPANDDRDEADYIWSGEPAVGTTVGATRDPGEADHAGDPGGHSVWFSYWAETDDPVVIDACDSSFDTTLAVYTSSYGGDQEVASSDDVAGCGPGGKGSMVRFTPETDMSYDIALDGHGGASGAYRVRVMSNDLRTGAIWLDGDAGWAGLYTNRLATADVGEPAHAGTPAAHSTWFLVPGADFGSPLGQQVEVNTCATALGGIDTVLAAYVETPSGLTELASDDDTVACGPGGTGSAIRFARPQSRVLVAVDGKAGAVGDFAIQLVAPPGNDDRAHAYSLWDSDAIDYTSFTTRATREPGEPAHAGDPGGRSVWYELAAARATRRTISLCDADFDTLLAVYTEASGSLEEVASNDDTAGCGPDGTGSRVSFDTTAGETYWVAVDGKAGAGGTVTLSLVSAARNDAFADAEYVASSTRYGNTVTGSAEPGEPAHAGAPAAHSLWYRLQATSSAPVTLDTCSWSDEPTRIAVYEGQSLGSLTPVTASGPVAGCAGGRGARVQFTPSLGGQPSKEYRIAVDAAGPGTGSFSLSIASAPGNDNRAGAVQLYEGGDWNGSTRVAGLEPGEPDHAGAGTNASLWYRWTPWRSSRARVDTCSATGTDTVVAVYTEGYGGLQEVAAGDDAAGCGNGKQSRVDFDAEANRTYYVAVATRAGQAGEFWLSASQRPANDDRAAAQTLYPGAETTWANSLGMATREAGEPDHGSTGASHSVWFRWTATRTGSAGFDTCDQWPVDSLLAVYSEGYGGLQEVASNDDAAGCGPAGKGSRLSFVADKGATYFVAVDMRDGPNDFVSLHSPLGNDFVDAASPLSPSGSSAYGDLSRATAEPGEPAHGGSPAARSRWYEWTPSRSTTGTVETCGYSGTRVAVYTGAASVTALTPVTPRAGSACGSGQSGSRVRFQATAGTTYRIAVDGTASFAVSARLGPENDLLANARTLYPYSDSEYGSTADGGREDGEADHAGAGGSSSAWYLVTAPWSGTATFDTCGSSFDTVLAAYAVSDPGIGGLTPVASSQSADCDPLRFHVQSGRTYAIAVDGSGGETGSFELEYRIGPYNDDLDNAQAIDEGERDADTRFAGRETGEVAHASAGGDASLWYSWTAPHDGPVRIDTCATETGFDSAIAVYRQGGVGHAGLALQAASDDADGCGSQGGRVRFQALRNITYLIAVDGHDATRGAARLTVEQAPANDNLASAVSLGTASTQQFGDTLEATHETGEPDHGGGTASAWYRWTPAHDGTTTVDTCGGADYESVVAVYDAGSGGLAGLLPVAAGTTDDAGCADGRGSRARFRAEAGKSYRIAVDGEAGAAGRFELGLVLAPANDEIEHPALLQPRVPATLETQGATRDPGEPEHGGPGGASVWYRFTAARTGTMTLTTCGSQYDTLLAVYSGSSDALTHLASDDEGGDCGAGPSRVTVAVTQGTQYLVAVDGRDGATGFLALTLDPPANDRFQDAETLTGRPAAAVGSTFGAGVQTGEPNVVSLGPVRTVWWKWTAPETRTVTITTCGSSYYAYPAVYTGGTVASLTRVGTNVGSCGFYGNRVSVAAVAGTTYRIQVDTPYDAAAVQVHIDPPDNDESSSATTLTLGADDTATADGSILGALRSPGELALTGDAVGKTVWYRWTAVSGAPVEIDTCDSPSPMVVRPFHGTLSPVPLRPVAEPCPDGSHGERVSFDGVAGRAYLFAVDGTAASSDRYLLRLAQKTDVTPPASSFTLQPGRFTSLDTIELRFHADETATFECWLDDAAPAACTSPVSFSGLEEGEHAFHVRATDRAGNVETAPAVAEFEVDRTPPDTTLSGGPTAPVHSSVSWQPGASEPAASYRCWVDDVSLGCSFLPESLAVGSHTLAMAAIDRAGNVDPTPAEATFEVADEAPVVAPEVTPVDGAAPLPVSLSLNASDPEDDRLTYAVDWGDGTAVERGTVTPDKSLEHQYAEAGAYMIVVRVEDPWLETVQTRTVEVARGEPLAARAGEDRVVEAGDVLTLDGGDSRPLAGIARYHWEFGDGAFADGRSVEHAYGEPGSYTARLTVTARGESHSDETTVRVVPPAPGGLTVTATTDGRRLAGTDVALFDAANQRFSGTTNEQGVVRLRGVPDGDYTIYAYKQGYRATTAPATVAGGSGSASVALVPGEVAAGTLASRPLPLDEILALGINPDDPANQHVYEFEVHINGIPIKGVATGGSGGGGGLWGATIGGGSCTSSGCVSHSGGYSYYTSVSFVDGKPMLSTLVLPFKASWLKEFFEVKMVVQNLAPSGFTLTGGRAQLEVPSGLSLAPISAPQAASMSVPDIPGGGSRTVNWTIRGDREGSYPLSASYASRLHPTDSAVNIHATTAKPLKVWGGSALELEVVVDDEFRDGHPFLATVKMKNVADVPVYNAVTELKKDGGHGYIEQPRQQRAFGTREIKPGETFEAGPFIVAPDESGEVDLRNSFIKRTGGDVEPAAKITTRKRVPALDDDPDFSAVRPPLGDEISLTWSPIPGASTYKLFRAPAGTARFEDEPIADIKGTSLAVDADLVETGDTIAVSSVVGGTLRMRHPVLRSDGVTAASCGDPSRPHDGFLWTGPTATNSPENCSTIIVPETVSWTAGSEAGPVTMTVAAEDVPHECSTVSDLVKTTVTCEFTGEFPVDGSLQVVARDEKGASIRTYDVKTPRGWNTPLGYSFENVGVADVFAPRAGLSQKDVLTDEVLARTFGDLEGISGDALRDVRTELWESSDGGSCFGMAITGGRFHNGADALHNPAQGRDDAAWSVGDEFLLEEPDGAGGSRHEYTREILQQLLGAFITQKSSEFVDAWDAQRSHYHRGDAADLLRDHLEKLLRYGDDAPYSDLSGPSMARLALIALEYQRGGHAVVAHGIRKHADGSFTIDVWDNNYPGDSRPIEVAADGRWSYPTADVSGDPRAGGKAARYLTAYPLFRPRGMHYTTREIQWGSGRALVDVPADTTVADQAAVASLLPVLTDGGEYRGATAVVESNAASVALEGATPSASARGNGMILSASRNGGSGPIEMSFDLDAATIGAGGGPATLTVLRDGDLYTATGAAKLTVKPDGTVDVVPDGTGRVLVTGPSGVIQDFDPTNPGGGGSTPGGGTGSNPGGGTGSNPGGGGPPTGPGSGGSGSGAAPAARAALARMTAPASIKAAKLKTGLPLVFVSAVKGARLKVEVFAAKGTKRGRRLKSISATGAGSASQRYALKLPAKVARAQAGKRIVVVVTASGPGLETVTKTALVRVKR